jgi:hypothetical protein
MKKDYEYRSTWKHFYSRAYNKAKRGNLTKKEMMELHGRFPRKNEWWLEETTESEWKEKYMIQHPKR